jgi:hypothetical protein
MTYTVDGDQRREILRQIGRSNVLAISGGRVTALEDGIELPVSNGYRVRVRLTPADYYRVERVFVRGGKEFDKGHLDDVDFTQVGNAAYYASCFRNDDGDWTYGKDKV